MNIHPIRCLWVLALFLAFSVADAREFKFRNRSTYDATDFHIEFTAPVKTNSYHVTPLGRNGNAEFTDVQVSPNGTLIVFDQGHVEGDSGPQAPPDEFILDVVNQDGSEPTIFKWWWTKDKDPIGPGFSGDFQDSQLTFDGPPATGDGRIELTIGSRVVVFQLTPGMTPEEAAAALREFLAGMVDDDDGKPLFYITIDASGRIVRVSPRTMGDPDFEPRFKLMPADKSQTVTISSVVPVQVADVNRDRRIGIDEVTSLGAQWRSGAFDDIDAVVRAATLWRGGEWYSYNPNETDPQARFTQSTPPPPLKGTLPTRVDDAVRLFRDMGATVWQQDQDGDGKPDTTFIDEDGDGIPDRVLIDVNEDGTAERARVDQDHDGDWDTTLENRDGDSHWDYAEIDEDRDGKYDHRWIDRDGDGNISQDEIETIDPELVPNTPRPIP